MDKEIEFLKESNAIEEVYDEDSLIQAVVAWKDLKKQKKLTVGKILKLHKTLMLNQPLLPNEKGYFRNIMVYVGGRAGLNAVKIPEAIEQWVLNVNEVIANGQKESKIFLEKITKEHHVNYERIHPFIDGNGRTGRMLMNWERLKVGLPLLIIHEGEEQMKYYKWFKE